MIALLSLLMTEPALAQDSDARARELYENGAMLYEEGRYEDAIAAWEEAYDLSERAALLYNIANAYERIGDYEAALDALGRYRAFAPASERESLDRRLRNIESRMAESGGSQSSGSGPSRQAPQIDLAPVGLVALGGVGLATGVAFAARSGSAKSSLDELCVAGTCPTEAQDLLDQNRRSALVADICFVTGTLAAAGGTVLWVVDDRASIRPLPGGLLLEATW